jgi:integrase
LSIQTRTIKNKRDAEGALTGRAGTVYDVFIRYKTDEGYKTYGKRGFTSKTEAIQHEAEMQVKLRRPGFQAIMKAENKQTLGEYLTQWVERYAKTNLRPSTYHTYQYHIEKYVIPHLGGVPLRNLTPALLDGMYEKQIAGGLSHNTVKSTHRVLGVALEHARKYNYIEVNPTKNIISKLNRPSKTPDPYTIEQMKTLMDNVTGTEWEMLVVLGGLYGMRRGEIVGLRWDNVDMSKDLFMVDEQLPFGIKGDVKLLDELAPVKSQERFLPITEEARPYFERQLALQAEQKQQTIQSGREYFDNRLVVANPDGTPILPNNVTAGFSKLLKNLELPHMRFHDLRHSAATNMHQLTGDFYTVGEILGHTLNGIGIQLGLSSNLNAVTERYVDVRLERKMEVLAPYHKAVHQSHKEPSQPEKKRRGRPPKKNWDMER